MKPLRATGTAIAHTGSMRALALCLFVPLAMSCLVTEKVRLPEEGQFPPTIVSAPRADETSTRLDQVITINLSETEVTELELPILVRDPNLDEDLEYAIFVDYTDGADPFRHLAGAGRIPATGEFEREVETSPRVGVQRLGAPGNCHKVEVLVSGEFLESMPRTPAVEGDVHQAVWWIRLVSDDVPAVVDMASCP